MQLCVLLFLAGLDTVTAQLSYSFWYLARHDADRARITAEPGIAPDAVEELLRAYSLVLPARRRTVDADVHGCPMRAGDMVMLPLMMANRDPRASPDPQTVDFDRANNRHIAFGAGPHRCLGAHLARLELRIALQEWHRRIPDYRIPDGARPTEHAGLVLGLETLPLTWETPGRHATPTPSNPMITWRRVTEDDFALLRRWLRRPHVARWWNHDTSVEGVARDFGPAARGEEPSEDWLALLDGRPFGLVQRCRLASYTGYLDELAAVTAVPPGAVTIDYLIGEPDLVGHGLGPRMIGEMIERIWEEYPDGSCVLVPVPVGNRASWRALEKAGLVRVAEGDLEPDNPIDGPAHVVYRIDRRPGAGA